MRCVYLTKLLLVALSIFWGDEVHKPWTTLG